MSLWEKQPYSGRAWAVELPRGEQSHAGGQKGPRVSAGCQVWSPPCATAWGCAGGRGAEERTLGEPGPGKASQNLRIGVFSCHPLCPKSAASRAVSCCGAPSVAGGPLGERGGFILTALQTPNAPVN